MEAELYSRDYQESPEFKTKYESKWQKAYKTALDEITTISIVDENGTERVANKADFDKVRNAANGVERRRMAKALFGEDADVAISHVNALNHIQESANEEISTHRSTYDVRRKDFEGRQKLNDEAYNKAQAETESELVKKYPQYFGDDPTDPESSAALKKGRDFVEQSLKMAGAMPPEDYAARTTVIKNWASAFPRLVMTLKNRDAKIAELEGQITQFRGSDPGSIEGGDGADKTANKTAGMAGLIAEFDEK